MQRRDLDFLFHTPTLPCLAPQSAEHTPLALPEVLLEGHQLGPSLSCRPAVFPRVPTSTTPPLYAPSDPRPDIRAVVQGTETARRLPGLCSIPAWGPEPPPDPHLQEMPDTSGPTSFLRSTLRACPRIPSAGEAPVSMDTTWLV